MSSFQAGRASNDKESLSRFTCMAKIGAACQDRAGSHRFFILLPFGYGPDSKVEIHGIRVVDGVPNDVIEGSGQKLTLLPAPHTPSPDLPRLAGQYHSLDAHPGSSPIAIEVPELWRLCQCRSILWQSGRRAIGSS